jgi:hypothetical protein
MSEETVCSTLPEFTTHPLTSMLFGALVTCVVAWAYYKRAGNELRTEAKMLQKTSNVIIYFLENPGANIKVQRHEEGRPVGLIVSAVGTASGSSKALGVGGHAEPHS